MKIIYKTILLIAITAITINLANSQNMQSKKHRVVMQLSSSDSLVHKGMIKQLGNLLTAMDSIQIEVVAHGPGIEFLMNNSSVRNNLDLLNQKGVRFLVCRNSMIEKNINPSSMPSLAEIIPAGIAHIIIRQEEGWSYIKAGF